MKSTRDYLTDILVYITRIEDVAKHGKADFVANYLFHDAVIREYEVIGEIIKRLPPELLTSQSGVNWKAIKGFRDFLAHNYERVDLNIIWDAVIELATLRSAIEALLDSQPPNNDDI